MTQISLSVTMLSHTFFSVTTFIENRLIAAFKTQITSFNVMFLCFLFLKLNHKIMKSSLTILI